MPSSSRRLKDRFFKHDADGNLIDDGIRECVGYIQSKGGTVSKGVITFPLGKGPDPVLRPELADAVQFLLEEWDYELVY